MYLLPYMGISRTNHVIQNTKGTLIPKFYKKPFLSCNWVFTKLKWEQKPHSYTPSPKTGLQTDEFKCQGVKHI